MKTAQTNGKILHAHGLEKPILLNFPLKKKKKLHIEEFTSEYIVSSVKHILNAYNTPGNALDIGETKMSECEPLLSGTH